MKSIAPVILILMLIPAALWAEDAAAQDAQNDEYLAFEFFFSGTTQQKYEMLEGQRTHKSFYDTTRALLDYRYSDFSLFVDWAMIDDERYDPSEVYMLGRYLYVNDAHVAYDTERFSVKAGRSTQQDIIDSPYSLFVNSEPIPSVQIETKYKGDYFFYTNRWVNLNHNAEQTYFGSGLESPFWGYEQEIDVDVDGAPQTGYIYPYRLEYPDGIPWVDRGAHFHIYGLNLGEWRFGFQESAVTFGESFSPEFFLSPMIMYFTQLVIDDGAKPWLEYANSKHFIGFFLDRENDEGYFASQILIDDINGDILPGVENKNQNRLAWSLGGYRNFNFGRIGLFHAGATKDTFGSTYASTYDDDTDYPNREYDEYSGDDIPLYYSYHPYPYTYYPAVQYQLEDGTPMPIDYTQNYIGYKYGENNLSFMLDYTNAFPLKSGDSLGIYGSLEWVLNGAKSPVNAWHEYDRWTHIPNPTQVLEGTVEHIVSLRTRVDRPVRIFGTAFSVFADLEAGMAFNAMGLEPARDDRADQEAWLYRPRAGVNEPLFELSIGMGYLWRVK